MGTESKTQREFRLEMNILLSTSIDKKHIFESKNDYKDYPCECGAVNNDRGSTCWRYRAVKIKEKYYKLLE